MSHQDTPLAQTSTRQWLISALGGEVDGTPMRALARPNADEPDLLLPMGSRLAMAASLRRDHQGRNLKSRLVGTAARSAGGVGVLPRLTGEVCEFPATRVTHALRSLAGDPDLQFSIGAGPPRRNRKPVIMLIRSTGETFGFAKVGWSQFTIDLVRNEYRMLELVHEHLPHPLRSPIPIDLMSVGELSVAVTTAIPARDWARRVALLPEQIDALARSVGHRMLRVGDLSWLDQPSFGESDDMTGQDLRAAVAGVATRFSDSELEVGVWHGDLNPWNLIPGRGGLGVIDWEFAGLDRPVGQDRRHLRFEKTRRGSAAGPERLVAQFVADELAGRSDRVELAVYLADIAIRESKLSGQGWSGKMAGYRAPLAAAIQDLIA